MIRLSSHPQPLTARRVLVALLASGLVLLCAGKADPQGATSSPDILSDTQTTSEEGATP